MQNFPPFVHRQGPRSRAPGGGGAALNRCLPRFVRRHVPRRRARVSSSVIRSTATTCSPVGGIEDDHALSAAPGNPNAIDRAADQLAAIGDEHDLVAILDRHGRDELAISLIDGHRDNAFAAASGDPVFVGRRPLAIAIRGDGQDDLLGGRHFRVTVGAEIRRGGRFLASRPLRPPAPRPAFPCRPRASHRRPPRGAS